MLCEKCGTGIPDNESLCAKCAKFMDARGGSSLNSTAPKQFYVHSGKIGPQLFFGGLILLIVTVLLSFVYAYASIYIPYLYFKILLIVGFVCGVGFSTTTALQSCKTRNTAFAVGFGLVSGIFALYAAWVTFEYVIFCRNNVENVEFLRLADPRITWKAICFLAESLRYKISGTEVTGAGLWTLWGIEAFAIVCTPTLLAYAHIKDSVFCEACKCWTVDLKNKLFFEYLSEKELKEKLINHDMSFLDNIVPIPPGADSFYRIDCRACWTCKNFYTLSLLRVTRVWSKEGQPSDKAKYVMKNLFISKDVFDKLTMLNQAESTPESEGVEENADQEPQEKTPSQE